MESVIKVMSILESGQWYDFKTLLSSCNVQEFDLKIILNYLTKFDLVQFNNEKKIFRLHPNMIGLINRLQDN
jgi:hypothetical protein